MKSIIWCFVKFFKEEKYADAFMQGKLRLNRLSYFRDMELQENFDDDDGRPDKHEAISHWLQPDDIKQMRISAPGFDEVVINKEDFGGPLSVAYDCHANLNALCFYAVKNVGFDVVDGRIRCSIDQQDEARRQFMVDERNFKFGEFAVIAPTAKLLGYLNKFLEARGKFFAYGLVEYYDETSFSGKFDFDEIPFKKQRRYSYQNEYRIVVDTETKGHEPLDISVGDMSEFCVKVRSNKLNEVLQLNFT